MASGATPESKNPSASSPTLQSSKTTRDIYAKFFTTRNLSVIVVGVVLIIALFRADPKDIPRIVEILAGSSNSAIIGWAIAFIILAGAVILVKLMKKIYENEIERLAKERDQLQRMLLERGGK
jgi:uncharacterized oligopeptide transporter (OPT) family protein